jgi:hypothetical protein
MEYGTLDLQIPSDSSDERIDKCSKPPSAVFLLFLARIELRIGL